MIRPAFALMFAGLSAAAAAQLASAPLLAPLDAASSGCSSSTPLRRAGSVLSGKTLSSTSLLYVAEYSPTDWSGDIVASAVGADGAARTEVWRAGSLIPAWSQRNILFNPGNKSARAFTWSQWQSAAPFTGSDSVTSEAALNWLRGSRAEEGNTLRTRSSSSLLGDITQFRPLVLGPESLDAAFDFLPTSGTGSAGQAQYRAWLRNKQGWPALLAAGANDGMLHLFDATTGSEVFAFIANAALPLLSGLPAIGYTHRYSGEGALLEADVWDSSASRWRNLLIATLGPAASALLALDVSGHASLSGTALLWEFSATSDARLGRITQSLAAGRMMNGQDAVIFGNGYGSGAGSDSALFILNALTGAVIRRIDLTGGRGLGGVAVLRDTQQRLVAAYAGDRDGRLWRFDLADASATNWRVGFNGQPLFIAQDSNGLAQSITAAPALLAHPRGGLLVLIGTGQLLSAGDEKDGQRQALYGLWDKTPGTQSSATGSTIAASDLVTQSRLTSQTASDGTLRYTLSSLSVDYALKRGWTLPLQSAGERVLSPPRLTAALLHADAVIPVAAPSCAAPIATQYALEPLSGAMFSQPIFDSNGDGSIGDGDTAIAARTALAEGVQALASLPGFAASGSAGSKLACPAGSVMRLGTKAGDNLCLASPNRKLRRWWTQIFLQ